MTTSLREFGTALLVGIGVALVVAVSVDAGLPHLVDRGIVTPAVTVLVRGYSVTVETTVAGAGLAWILGSTVAVVKVR